VTHQKDMAMAEGGAHRRSDSFQRRDGGVVISGIPEMDLHVREEVRKVPPHWKWAGKAYCGRSPMGVDWWRRDSNATVLR
jgi:hypothetical protein